MQNLLLWKYDVVLGINVFILYTPFIILYLFIFIFILNFESDTFDRKVLVSVSKKEKNHELFFLKYSRISVTYTIVHFKINQ